MARLASWVGRDIAAAVVVAVVVVAVVVEVFVLLELLPCCQNRSLHTLSLSRTPRNRFPG